MTKCLCIFTSHKWMCIIHLMEYTFGEFTFSHRMEDEQAPLALSVFEGPWDKEEQEMG